VILYRIRYAVVYYTMTLRGAVDKREVRKSADGRRREEGEKASLSASQLLPMI